MRERYLVRVIGMVRTLSKVAVKMQGVFDKTKSSYVLGLISEMNDVVDIEVLDVRDIDCDDKVDIDYVRRNWFETEVEVSELDIHPDSVHYDPVKREAIEMVVKEFRYGGSRAATGWDLSMMIKKLYEMNGVHKIYKLSIEDGKTIDADVYFRNQDLVFDENGVISKDIENFLKKFDFRLIYKWNVGDV